MVERTLPRQETKQEATSERAIDVADQATQAEAKEASEAAHRVALEKSWTPKTSLGKAVLEGRISNIALIFEKGYRITEPGIVDSLIPDLKHEIILIGGSGGKGGGKRKTPTKRTTRMHKSGRRFRISAMVVVGNCNGYVGLGSAHGPAGRHREVIEKALAKAKLNLIPIRRGCGSWECGCGAPHSVPFEINGKTSSVEVKLIPAPKGVGLVVMDEVKKIMRLAGISDVWCKSRGSTSTTGNMAKAVFDALKKMNRFKVKPEYAKAVGMVEGAV